MSQPIASRRGGTKPLAGEPESSGAIWPVGVFEADDLSILAAAYETATVFLGARLSPTQRLDMAKAIIKHARGGVRDPRRLAIKAIVAV